MRQFDAANAARFCYSSIIICTIWSFSLKGTVKAILPFFGRKSPRNVDFPRALLAEKPGFEHEGRRPEISRMPYFARLFAESVSK